MDSTLLGRDPDIMSGAPCFTATRVLVQTLFDHLEGGSSLEESPQDSPSVSRATVVAVPGAARVRLFDDAPAA